MFSALPQPLDPREALRAEGNLWGAREPLPLPASSIAPPVGVRDPFVKGREKSAKGFTRKQCSPCLRCFSDLEKQEERGELLQPLIFVSLVLSSILLYFRVSLMDPGFVKAEEEEKV